MFPDLVDLFSLFSNSDTNEQNSSKILPISGSLFLLTETLRADVSFIIHHFLSLYLKNAGRVILVGLEHHFQHYFLIGKKVRMNLVEEEESGNFKFIDLVSKPFVWCENNPNSLNQISKSKPLSFDASKSNVLEELYLEIEKNFIQMEASNLKKPCCLIIDCFNILLNVTNCVAESIQFIQYCQTLIQQKVMINWF